MNLNIYNQYVRAELELYHHGVAGQKWGVRNGPPYPLVASNSSSGKKRKILNGYTADDVQRLFDSIPKGDVSYGQKHKDYKETIYRDMYPGKAFIEMYKSPEGDGIASVAIDVHPKYRSQGLGTKLVKRAINNSKKLGINRIEWYCDKTNTGSIKLAQKCGFKIDNDLSNNEQYTLFYGKRLK